MQPLLSATALEHWADTRQAEDQLPLMIRRLVLATVNPLHIDFPSGDSVNLPGFDGLLRTTGPAPLVPAGQSCWEMGRGNDPREKANEDYKGRTANPRGIDPKKTTFVFVTPRRWQGKSDWANEKREEKVWGDVRVIDAVDLEQWLDRTPAVATWARRQVVGAPDGLQDLDDLWQQWECRTQPPLTPDLLTVSRQQAVDRVRQWLEAPASLLRVRGDTTEEVLGFLVAVIRTLGEPHRERVLARSLVVSTPEAWRALHFSTGVYNGWRTRERKRAGTRAEVHVRRPRG